MADRVLVLGASGMLGHESIRVLAPDMEVWGACRDPGALPDLGIPKRRLLGGLDAARPDDLEAMVQAARPDLVVNAVGIVKQREEAGDAIPTITANSLWPHAVARACAAHGARMVQVSTDCVFSGARGGYTEDDVPDEPGLYGRSKLLGEIATAPHVVTLRTSIVGWQIGRPTGLFGWFAAHRDEPLRGYRRAIFSGLTTRALTEMIRDTVLRDPALSGLWHVSADPIDKHSLLTRLADHLGWNVDITPVDEPVIDRSLDSTRLRERTGWAPATWDDMLAALAREVPENPSARGLRATG
jgi:dTDP-4-dehydrorhamnose reductase